MAKHEPEKRDYPGPWGPPDMSIGAVALAAIFALAVAYAGYNIWNWWSGSHSSRSTPVAPATATPGHAVQPNPNGNSELGQERTRSATATGPVVVKCVMNGATTYVASEADCSAPAKATIVRIDSKENLSDGLPNAEQIIRQPSPYTQNQVTQAGPDPNVQRLALCQAYEEEIKAIDAQARQPLSGQEQDWLTGKRRKARDEQFRLHC